MQVGIGILVIASIVLLYGAFSERLGRLPVSAAMVFTTAGVLVGPAVLGAYGANITGPAVVYLTKTALALMLFNDAVRIDLQALRRAAGIPERLLGVALPLCILMGAAAAWLLFPGLPLAELLLLALILAPTDASLVHPVVGNKSVPAQIRQGLNVESGLGDGLVVPLFLVALDAAHAAAGSEPWSRVAIVALEQIGWGVVAGVGAGIFGGLIIRLLDGRMFIERAWRQIMAVGTVAGAYGLSQALGGSVLLAAFVAGIMFGIVAKKRGLGVLYLNEQMGAVLAAATFITFGALALGPNLGGFSWRMVLYGVLSLTVVRMLPVAAAMVGARVKPITVLFIGWFGPRGLASIAFGLMLLAEAVPNARALLLTVTFTVALSIYLHGMTALPLARAYTAWFERRTQAAGPMAEGKKTTEIRIRYGEDVVAKNKLGTASDEGRAARDDKGKAHTDSEPRAGNGGAGRQTG